MNRNIRIIRIAAATVIAGAALLVVIHYRVGLAKWVLAGSVERSSDVHAAHTTAPAEKQILYYYDAMSPEHHYDKPGKSPDGMDLVPQYADEDAGMENMPAGTVRLSQSKQQLIGVQTTVVQREKLFRTIRAVGQLTADETKLAHVHLKVSGWIEQVYVDYVGKLVKKGEPLFTIYSPDLVATEQEYLIARRGKQNLEIGRASCRERVKVWGREGVLEGKHGIL